MATQEGIAEHEGLGLRDSPGADAPFAEDLRAQSMKALDFHELRRQVANRVTFFPARELALEMVPSYSPLEVEELQRETSEAVALLEDVGGVDLHLAVDTSDYVARAGIGGVLTGTELLSVADALEVHSRAVAAVGRPRAKPPLLSDIVAGIPELSELRRQIRKKIDARGNVADDATPSLRALRRQVLRAYDRVTETLHRLIRSDSGREALQEPLVTTRNERVVVPVKAEMRSRVPGIVHDASNTGATLYVEPVRDRGHGQRLARAGAGGGAGDTAGAAGPVGAGRAARGGHQAWRRPHREARLHPGQGPLRRGQPLRGAAAARYAGA